MIYSSTSGTLTFNNWFPPERIEVIELNNKIEFIYKETSMMLLPVYPSISPEQRVFKIVFSCIDGLWNRSERIYGNIIRSSDETYSF